MTGDPRAGRPMSDRAQSRASSWRWRSPRRAAAAPRRSAQPPVLAAWSQVVGVTRPAEAEGLVAPSLEMRFVLAAGGDCAGFGVRFRLAADAPWQALDPADAPPRAPARRGAAAARGRRLHAADAERRARLVRRAPALGRGRRGPDLAAGRGRHRGDRRERLRARALRRGRRSRSGAAPRSDGATRRAGGRRSSWRASATPAAAGCRADGRSRSSPPATGRGCSA